MRNYDVSCVDDEEYVVMIMSYICSSILPFFYFVPLFLGKGTLIAFIIGMFSYAYFKRNNFKPFMLSSDMIKICITWMLLFLLVLFSTYKADVSFFHNDGPLFMFVLSLLFLSGKFFVQLTLFDMGKYYKSIFFISLISLILIIFVLWCNKKFNLTLMGDINALFCTFTNIQLILFSYLTLDFAQNKTYQLSIIVSLLLSYIIGCSLFTSDLRYIMLPISIILLCLILNSNKLYNIIISLLPPITIATLLIFKYISLPQYINFATNNPIQLFFEGRDVIWTIATKGFFESPFWGNGPKTFSSYFAGNINLIFPNYERLFHGTHSLPLYILFSYGILGFMCVMALIFLYLKYLSHAIRNDELRGQVLIIISSWLPIVTYGLIDYASFIDSQMGLLILSLGVLEGLILKQYKK